MKVSDILERAADLIEPEGRWTQGRYAADARGRHVYVNEPEAVRFCLTGSIAKTLGQRATEAENWIVHNKVARLLGRRSLTYILAWNDAPERTQSEVVAKLREAAAKARSEGR